MGLAKTKARIETRCAALSLLEVIPIQWLLEQRELQLNLVQPAKIGWRATWCRDVSQAVLQTVQDPRAETRLRLAALRCLVQTSTCDYESFAVVGVASSDLGGLSYCMQTNRFVLTFVFKSIWFTLVTAFYISTCRLARSLHGCLVTTVRSRVEYAHWWSEIADTQHEFTFQTRTQVLGDQ